MISPVASARLRRAEVALLVIGCGFLGWASWDTVARVAYQTGQERALGEMELAAALPPGLPGPARARALTVAGAGADPLLLGRIEIPRLDLAAIVREGADDATLSVAVGHVPGTAKPGERGNVVLAGHRDSLFRALRGIRLHDTIRISTPGGEDEYAVESTEVVGPREIRVLAPSAEARLTLVTCFPFGFVGRAPKRFIVRAALSPK